MEPDRLKLKSLLGITDDSKDGILDFILQEGKDMICNYCRIEKIPKGLESLYLDMCVSLYRAEGYGQESANSVIKSITEGDVNLSFGSAFSSSDDSGMSFFRNYQKQLNRYRNAGW